MKFFHLFVVLAVLGLFTGCARERDEYSETWHDLIVKLQDTDRIARLDTLSAGMVSSSDPTGGNQDYNQFLREGPEGWWVIADLEGPGYISRFWFTGAQDNSHRVRFYFDGEETPRIDLTIGEFCGGLDPFLPPLAVRENYCWYNLIPIPYEESVVVMVEEGGFREGGWPRIFYQINYHDLPENRRVASFPEEITDEDRAVIAQVREAWKRGDFHPKPEDAETLEEAVTIDAGRAASVELPPGPGILRGLTLEPDFDALDSAMAREALLRQMVLNIYWDDTDQPSVSVPFGDFFGAFWRRNRYETLYVGSQEDRFFSRLPKPYARSARLELVNESSHDIPVRVALEVEPVAELSEEWGYFHADWQRTTPADEGHPHVALSREGAGKFVGTMLAVVSADQSWWILEADETIRVDDETTPGWEGTGLEDYFNGGWYYQNAIVRLLAGIPFKMPFRVLQYRFHLMDPVHFSDSIDVEFERGTENDSRGWMESVAYYYMDRPMAAGSRLLTVAERAPPDEGMSRHTAMTEINNMERIGDYRGAHDFIDYFLERFPDFPHAETLRLRQIAYIEKRDGIEAARPLYEAFRENTDDPEAAAHADNLLWFHEDPSHALLSAYCNAASAVFLNGSPIARVESPDTMSIFRVSVEPGPNVLAIQTRFHPYPNWVQTYLRTHYGDVYTTPDWRWRFAARGPWTSRGYDDSDWNRVGGTGVKGPPEVPHVWVTPHPYVDMQSVAVGIRHRGDWHDRNVLAAFRKEFVLPKSEEE